MQIYELWEGLLVQGFIIWLVDCLGVCVHKILLFFNYNRKWEATNFIFDNVYIVFMKQ